MNIYFFGINEIIVIIHLHDWRRDQELFQECIWPRIVPQTECCVLQYPLRGVSRLLTGDPQIFLERTGQGGEERLGGFVGVHRRSRG